MPDNEAIERRLKLHDLRVLMSVVDAGSMGKAAERLRTSQPAISRTVASLEHMLGRRLLERTPSGVAATAYGHALIRRGQIIFDELRHGITDLDSLADGKAGEVRIASSIIVGVSFVSRVIERLSQRYPQLAFDVGTGDSERAYRQLEERAVDLAIVHMVGPRPETRIQVETLYQDHHVVATSAVGFRSRRRKLALQDLINEPWTLPPRESRLGMVANEAFRAAELNLPKKVVFASLPIRQALLATGRYFTIVSEHGLAFLARTAGVKALPIPLPTTRRPVALLTLKNRMLSPSARLFIEEARSTARLMKA